MSDVVSLAPVSQSIGHHLFHTQKFTHTHIVIIMSVEYQGKYYKNHYHANQYS